MRVILGMLLSFNILGFFLFLVISIPGFLIISLILASLTGGCGSQTDGLYYCEKSCLASGEDILRYDAHACICKTEYGARAEFGLCKEMNPREERHCTEQLAFLCRSPDIKLSEHTEVCDAFMEDRNAK
jgi:hypothetical protein